MKAEQLSRQLLMQIAVLNSTRLDPITVEDFTSWITNAFSLFKEWAGMFVPGSHCPPGMRSRSLAYWLFKKRTYQTQNGCLPGYDHH